MCAAWAGVPQALPCDNGGPGSPSLGSQERRGRACTARPRAPGRVMLGRSVHCDAAGASYLRIFVFTELSSVPEPLRGWNAWPSSARSAASSTDPC
jgi:hypothetical protein